MIANVGQVEIFGVREMAVPPPWENHNARKVLESQDDDDEGNKIFEKTLQKAFGVVYQSPCTILVSNDLFEEMDFEEQYQLEEACHRTYFRDCKSRSDNHGEGTTNTDTSSHAVVLTFDYEMYYLYPLHDYAETQEVNEIAKQYASAWAITTLQTRIIEHLASVMTLMDCFQGGANKNVTATAKNIFGTRRRQARSLQDEEGESNSFVVAQGFEGLEGISSIPTDQIDSRWDSCKVPVEEIYSPKTTKRLGCEPVRGFLTLYTNDVVVGSSTNPGENENSSTSSASKSTVETNEPMVKSIKEHVLQVLQYGMENDVYVESGDDTLVKVLFVGTRAADGSPLPWPQVNETILDDSTSTVIPTMNETIVDNSTIYDESTGNNTIVNNSTISDEPTSNNTVVDNSTVSDEPTSNNTVVDNSTVSDEPTANNTIVDNSTMSDEPTANNTIVDNSTLSDEPTANNTIVDNSTMSDEPTTNNTIVDNSTMSDEPTTNNTIVDNSTMSDEPTTNNTIVDNSTMSDEPTANNTIVDSSTVSDGPTMNSTILDNATVSDGPTIVNNTEQNGNLNSNQQTKPQNGNDSKGMSPRATNALIGAGGSIIVALLVIIGYILYKYFCPRTKRIQGAQRDDRHSSPERDDGARRYERQQDDDQSIDAMVAVRFNGEDYYCDDEQPTKVSGQTILVPRKSQYVSLDSLNNNHDSLRCKPGSLAWEDELADPDLTRIV